MFKCTAVQTQSSIVIRHVLRISKVPRVLGLGFQLTVSVPLPKRRELISTGLLILSFYIINLVDCFGDNQDILPTRKARWDGSSGLKPILSLASYVCRKMVYSEDVQHIYLKHRGECTRRREKKTITEARVEIVGGSP